MKSSTSGSLDWPAPFGDMRLFQMYACTRLMCTYLPLQIAWVRPTAVEPLATESRTVEPPRLPSRARQTCLALYGIDDTGG